jgi:FemAB family
MKLNYPIYFCQNPEWTAFWAGASGANHQIITWQNIQIYEYPWQISRFQIGKFWYIPKARFQSQEQWVGFIRFLQKTKNGKQKIDFIKIDFDLDGLEFVCPTADFTLFEPKRPDLLDFDLDLEIKKTHQKILENLQKSLKEVAKNEIKIYQSAKKIQYLQATTINLEQFQPSTTGQKPSANLLIIPSEVSKIKSQKQPISLEDELEKSKKNGFDDNFENGEKKMKDNLTDNLTRFYNQNELLWQSFNERVRRYSRKLLKDYQNGKYLIITEKSDQTFEEFYQLHTETATRQNFPTQNKNYLRQLFDQDFSRVIIIKKIETNENSVLKSTQKTQNIDQKLAQELNSTQVSNQISTQQTSKILAPNSGKFAKNETVESAFLGIIFDGTLTYLLGGNSTASLKNHTQYLLQMKALEMTSVENCQFYDMGGWESGSGYGEFKNGYRGKLRTFFGPFDLVFHSPKYQFVIFLINFGKSLRQILTRILSRK